MHYLRERCDLGTHLEGKMIVKGKEFAKGAHSNWLKPSLTSDKKRMV